MTHQAKVRKPGIIIKGSHVVFEMEDGSTKRLPASHGIIHDPYGEHLPRCEVFFGPYRETGKPADKTWRARHYLGAKYEGHEAVVDVPRAGWNPVGRVVELGVYLRHGDVKPGLYHHPFKGAPQPLEKSGNYYRLIFPDNCIYDDRGIVFP